jgi:hypothetical protein
MPVFEVTLVQSSTAKLKIEADNEEKAIEQAWDIACDRYFEVDSCEIDYVKELDND